MLGSAGKLQTIQCAISPSYLTCIVICHVTTLLTQCFIELRVYE